MSFQKDAWLDINERFLGKSVGATIPILGDTACMSLEFREIHVVLKHLPGIMVFFEENPKATITQIIERIYKPVLDDLGHVNWKRDILTDLAFALSKESKQILDLTEDDKPKTDSK